MTGADTSFDGRNDETPVLFGDLVAAAHNPRTAADVRARSLAALVWFEGRETPIDGGYTSREQLLRIHDRRLRTQRKRSREITVGLPELVAELRALRNEHVMLIALGDLTFAAHFFLAGEPLRILQMVSKPPIRS